MSEFIEVPQGTIIGEMPYTLEEPVSGLRWVVPPHTSTEPKRLQQQFRVVEYVKGQPVSCVHVWRDVPTVILPPSEPNRP
jgi:hypothetical protein